MDAQMKRGFLDACVLATLLAGESYGYQIIKDAPSSLGLSESTLYPLLKRLETRGLISVRKAEHNGRLRKYYSLTADGRAAVRDFLEDRAEILSLYQFVQNAALNSGKSPMSLEVAASESVPCESSVKARPSGISHPSGASETRATDQPRRHADSGPKANASTDDPNCASSAEKD